MTNTMKSAAVYRIFFTEALRNALAAEASYKDEVDEWYATGDGASPEWVEAGTQDWFDFESGDDPSRLINLGGKGYRFPACIHGMSYWTDYDNICGGCEDGATALTVARGVAREKWLRFCDRWQWVTSAPGDLPGEAQKENVKWMMSLWPKKA